MLPCEHLDGTSAVQEAKDTAGKEQRVKRYTVQGLIHSGGYARPNT